MLAVRRFGFEDAIAPRAAFRSGYAVRRNATCNGNEIDCGKTVTPYHACCPERSFCNSPKLNANCCPTASSCTISLEDSPQCANETWNMYDNDGWFCCEQGLRGYASRLTNGDGCASSGYILKSGEVFLDIVIPGKITTKKPSHTSTTKPNTKPSDTSAVSSDLPSSISDITSSGSSTITSASTSPSYTSALEFNQTSTSQSTPSATDAASSSPSSTNAGAIAGGVVGGGAALVIIALLMWFFRRRRAKSNSVGLRLSSTNYTPAEPEKDSTALLELSKKGVSELPGREGKNVEATELPGQDGKAVAATELPGQVERGYTVAELYGKSDDRSLPAELP